MSPIASASMKNPSRALQRKVPRRSAAGTTGMPRCCPLGENPAAWRHWTRAPSRKSGAWLDSALRRGNEVLECTKGWEGCTDNAFVVNVTPKYVEVFQECLIIEVHPKITSLHRAAIICTPITRPTRCCSAGTMVVPVRSVSVTGDWHIRQRLTAVPRYPGVYVDYSQERRVCCRSPRNTTKYFGQHQKR